MTLLYDTGKARALMLELSSEKPSQLKLVLNNQDVATIISSVLDSMSTHAPGDVVQGCLEELLDSLLASIA